MGKLADQKIALSTLFRASGSGKPDVEKIVLKKYSTLFGASCCSEVRSVVCVVGGFYLKKSKFSF